MTPARPQRAGQRIWPFVASCHVVQGDRRIPGYLTELSGAGARVLCHEEPPSPGAAVVLEMRLGRRPTRSPFPARVVWSGDGPAGARVFGLAFGEIGSDERRLLDAVVADFHRRAAELG